MLLFNVLKYHMTCKQPNVGQILPVFMNIGEKIDYLPYSFVLAWACLPLFMLISFYTSIKSGQILSCISLQSFTICRDVILFWEGTFFVDPLTKIDHIKAKYAKF